MSLSSPKPLDLGGRALLLGLEYRCYVAFEIAVLLLQLCDGGLLYIYLAKYFSENDARCWVQTRQTENFMHRVSAMSTRLSIESGSVA